MTLEGVYVDDLFFYFNQNEAISQVVEIMTKANYINVIQPQGKQFRGNTFNKHANQ